MKFQSFEDIRAWQDARTLTNSIRRICLRIQHRDYGWVDQISRAANSIMANIAEGNDAQSNAQFSLFLSYAKRSAAELRSHLYYGLDQQYLSKDEFSQMSVQSKKIVGQLVKLIQYLQKHSGEPRNVSARQNVSA